MLPLRRRFAALVGFACGLASAQTTASVFGVVHDSSGAVVPQVVIGAVNSATGFKRAVRSDENGNYLITNLPVGLYAIEFEKSGFRRFVQDGIRLEVDDHAREDATLTVGQVTEKVTVSAEATGVDTLSAAVGEVVDHTRIQELPLNGRNAMGLVRLVPGVAKDNVPTALSQARQGQANFGAPVAALNNRNFGNIQSAGDPRILQFAWRYLF